MLVCSPLLTSYEWRELVSSGRLVCMPSFSDVSFVLFRFRLYASTKAAALRSTVLRYAGTPTATRTCFFPFPLCFFLDVAFSECFLYHWRVFSLYITCREYVVGSFLPGGVLLPCDHELFFSH